MAHLEPASVARQVSNLLDLSIDATSVGRSGALTVRLVGLERPGGLSVNLRADLSSAYADLQTDNLARPLLDTISAASVEQWRSARSILDALTISGIRVELIVNGEPLTAEAPAQVLTLRVRARGLDWMGDLERCASELCASVLSAVLPLLPIDTALPPTEPEEAEYGVEGELRRREHNVYERSRSNRAIAILVHGRSCTSCGFDFETFYGEYGGGYVEIHHLTPVHLMSGPRVVNPIEELVPLCANCHRMVHRIDPPLHPSALREIIDANESRSGGSVSP